MHKTYLKLHKVALNCTKSPKIAQSVTYHAHKMQTTDFYYKLLITYENEHLVGVYASDMLFAHSRIHY